jgi:hypothetical protein
MKKYCYSWTYNTVRVQEEGSTVCGHHCILLFFNISLIISDIFFFHTTFSTSNNTKCCTNAVENMGKRILFFIFIFFAFSSFFLFFFSFFLSYFSFLFISILLFLISFFTISDIFFFHTTFSTSNNTKCCTNAVAVQADGSTVCGHHCVFYLIHRCSGQLVSHKPGWMQSDLLLGDLGDQM